MVSKPDSTDIRTLPDLSGWTGKTIRAVPYTGLTETNVVDIDDGNVTIPEFKTFMRQASGTPLQKWNLDNLNGIEILKENPTSDTGSFTSDQQDYIEDVINASDNGGILFNGRTVNVVKHASRTNQDRDKKYTVTGSTITPERGWIVIVPEHNPGYHGRASAWDIGSDGYADSGRIELNSDDSDIYNGIRRTIAHELAHVTLYDTAGHTRAIRNNKSVISKISTGSFCTKPCSMDKKAAKLIYEDTFEAGTPLGEILGTSWHN